MTVGGQFYGDLAEWWPLLSPVAEYEEEAEFCAGVLAGGQPPVQTVLELGSGGGNNAFYLKRRFDLTLVDLSPEMLAVSRRLNPECEHQQGDMRTLRLGRSFDAVFVHDAVMYMTTEADLSAAIRTAYEHCRPGGTAVFVPDQTTETFQPSTEHGGADESPSGRGARYLAWSWDPDPADAWTVTEFAFLLRDADGTVRRAHDSHRTGLFPRETWLRLLAEAGFTARTLVEVTTEQRQPRELFVGTRTKEDLI